ncbi:hypothetical protein AL01_01785 [Bombella intestini]|uniref:hydroxymethylpyrimidine kinase n=1 Tax=Bombella intestini TaxID=1539051 RepID=A0A1S8GS98_9PROT|nr:bifunctional hydroxymethylpyrimidine kinase/phosphomethylpyrimidine kinase [Bombella intestini]OOL19718.1 hypothetical protein AL01_01785 [Bombella intestini]
MTDRSPTVLTIAGTDPTGSAGILADVKTISALGGYALPVVTAVIAQNSYRVLRRLPVAAEMIFAQLEAVREAMPIDAIKIGLLPSVESVQAVSSFLMQMKQSGPIVVLDPVLQASTQQCLADDVVSCIMREHIFPYVSLVTPNLSESARLLERDVAQTRNEMILQAEALRKLGIANVLLKGGHLSTENVSSDLLVTEDDTRRWYEVERIVTSHDRGTGCTLASALAFFLIDHTMQDAVGLAKNYVTQTLRTANELQLVVTRGPLNHFNYSKVS